MTPFQVKLAYDYEHERRQLERHHLTHKDTPKSNPVASGVTGAGLGLALGAGLGLLAAYGRVPLNPMKSTAIGAAAGTAIGALGGFAGAMNKNYAIDESNEIASMPDEDRSAYLRRIARDKEIAAREAAEWDRAHYQSTRSDFRRLYT